MQKFLQLITIINTLKKRGVLKPEDSSSLKKDIRELKHAVSIKDNQKILKVVNRFSKKLLEMLG